MKKRCIIFAVAFGASASVALADAPVVDLSQSAASHETAQTQLAQNQPQTTQDYSDDAQTLDNPIQQSLSLDQRVAKLQRQVNNLARMDLPGQITQLQQQVQQLQGQLQVQQHDLKTLNEQQRNFYQDLDQRLSNLKALVENGVASSSSNSSSNASTSTYANKNAEDLLAKELKAYENAFKYVRQKSYDKAISSLKSFLDEYPNGKFAVNAHYWLGEMYYLQGNKDQAKQELQTVINKYSKSRKVPDAMLKYAYILRDNGETKKARSELHEIVKKYPNSSAARLAKLQLKQLTQPMQQDTSSASTITDSTHG